MFLFTSARRDMKERSLEGTLAPDLGKLSDLRFL